MFLEKNDDTSDKVLSALIKSKCLPILFHGTEACPLPLKSDVKHSLEFTINTVKYCSKHLGLCPNVPMAKFVNILTGKLISRLL